MLSNIRIPLGALALVPLASGAVFDLPITVRNSYALAEVSVGTPAVKHSLLFDTGSATTWIVDKECADSCSNRSGWSRAGYDITASTTSTNLGTYAEIEYLGGVTGGIGVEDVFTLGETQWTQSFMAANETTWTWTPADGFLGLAFSTITVVGDQTVVESMIQQKLLDSPRFSLYYGKEFKDTGGAAGEGVLTIGGSKEAKYVDGDMTWVPLQNSGEYQLWRSTIRAVTGTVQGEDSVTKAENSWAIFDTGSGYISVPPGSIDAIYQSIGMNYSAIYWGDHIPLCSEFNSSWSVSFTYGESDVDSQTVTLTGDQLAKPGFAYRDDACFPPFDNSGVDGFYLIGKPMLHQLYTVFDFGGETVSDYQPRIGFGQLKSEFKP
ncbi:pepsinogen c [Biscogniauxia marginata]|nr:pepsinogen c [Biscogniauxia marginata]